VPWSLRKGDELVDFFETFRKMVVALRDEREAHMKVLEDAANALGDDKPEVQESLRNLRAEMQKSLG